MQVYPYYLYITSSYEWEEHAKAAKNLGVMLSSCYFGQERDDWNDMNINSLLSRSTHIYKKNFVSRMFR